MRQEKRFDLGSVRNQFGQPAIRITQQCLQTGVIEGQEADPGAVKVPYFLASGVTLTLRRSPLRSTMIGTGLPIFTASMA